MCSKLFILKEFYFLILESNVGPHYKYLSKWLSTKTKDFKGKKSTKTKEFKINESLKKVLYNN